MHHTYDIRIRRGLDSKIRIPDWSRLSIEEDLESETPSPGPASAPPEPGFRGASRWFLRALWNLLTFWRHSPPTQPAQPTQTTGQVVFRAAGEDEPLKVPATFERTGAGRILIRGNTTVRHGDLRDSESFGCEILVGGLSGRLWMKPLLNKDFEEAEDTEAYIQEAGGGG